jgi:tetratricopeptide (TPR) repeat protein
LNISPQDDGQSTRRTGCHRPTWLQVLALLVVSGIIVFVVTRQMYDGKIQADLVGNNDTSMTSAKSEDGELEINTAMLESLLSLDSNENDPLTMSLLANEYFANKQYSEAADLYSQLSTIDPNNVEIQNNHGLTLHYINESEEALAVLLKGSTLDPGNQRIRLTIGFVNKEIGNVDAARLALEAAESIDPNSDVGRSASRMLSEL